MMTGERKFGDLKRLAAERRHGNSVENESKLDEKATTMTTGVASGTPAGRGGATRILMGSRSTTSLNASSNHHKNPSPLERPATRKDVAALESELEDRVRLVMETTFQTKELLSEEITSTVKPANSSMMTKEMDTKESTYEVYNPTRESLRLVQRRLLQQIGGPFYLPYETDETDDMKQTDPNEQEISYEQEEIYEPWLETYIRCESLRGTCDDITGRFADMLGVVSAEYGGLSRKLRLAQKQAFEQLANSWNILRLQYQTCYTIVRNQSREIKSLKNDLADKEAAMMRTQEKEINRLTNEFLLERSRDAEARTAAEFRAEQMADTLKHLNGIFRNMQADGGAVKAADLNAMIQRLTTENMNLSAERDSYEAMQVKLQSCQEEVNTLREKLNLHKSELTQQQFFLAKREEVIAHLMEREVVRNAEIEKLQKAARLKEDELLSLDMREAATSVLCIKCKRSLDDLSNIRTVLMGGDTNSSKRHGKLQCENFRLLLPNVRGNKPSRTIAWLRVTMRSILLSKIREDISLCPLRANTVRFPAFVYSWFSRITTGLTGTSLTKVLHQCDEDRWGFYYGLRLMYKEDAEFAVLWSLLDESFGQDGMYFTLYVFSVVLSLGGEALWRQFGRLLSPGGVVVNIESLPLDDLLNPGTTEKLAPPEVIWLDLATAKNAVHYILGKSLGPHISNALDAIDAMKVRPDELIPTAAEREVGNAAKVASDGTGSIAESHSSSPPPKPSIINGEATHINLFLFIRIMLQQLQADQIHRSAAIRLMFETASVGALTPSFSNGGPNDSVQATNGTTNHVEFPQFQSICRTLFSHLSTSDIASFYQRCYMRNGGIKGPGKGGVAGVTYDIFVSEADHAGFFTRALRLPSLPLLKQVTVVPSTQFSYADEQSEALSWAGLPIQPLSDDLSEVISVPDRNYSSQSQSTIRSKLASMVHRRLASITPHLKFLSATLPETWRTLIAEVLDNVKVSLDESYVKLKQWQSENSSNTSNANLAFLDGIQPYLSYRRLISLVSLAQSVCENPFLPGELFREVDLSNSHAITHALSRADQCLAYLEESLFAPYSAPPDSMLGVSNQAEKIAVGAAFTAISTVASSATNLNWSNKPAKTGAFSSVGTASLSNAVYTSGGRRHLEKYRRFEAVRQILVVRRLQHVYRKFLAGQEVPIPRSVRMKMSPGYLSNNRVQTSPNKSPLPPLKMREVYREAWWGQATISSIYQFKIRLDKHSASLGLPPIPLSQAVVAWHYYTWGATEVSERMTHDLFVCVRTYRVSCSRMRLFAVFLSGEESSNNNAARMSVGLNELEQDVLDVLASPQAISIFFHLISAIHEIVQMYSSQSSSFGTLFPSAVNPFERTDHQEDWRVNANLLLELADQWGSRQTWLRGNHSIYKSVIEKIPRDQQNTISVDDFLWLLLLQWARLEAWQIRRAVSRGSLVQQSLSLSLGQSNQVDSAVDGGKSTIKDNGSVKVTIKSSQQSVTSNPKVDSEDAAGKNGLNLASSGSLTRTLSLLPLSNLKTLVESIYQSGASDVTVNNQDHLGATLIADARHYASSYISCLRSRRPVLSVLSDEQLEVDLQIKSGVDDKKHTLALAHLDDVVNKELLELLRDCVLWDTNVGIFETNDQVTDSDISSNPKEQQKESSIQSIVCEAIRRSASLTSRPICKSPFNPELACRMLKVVFQSYQNPINNFLNKTAEDSRWSFESDVKQRIQSTRFHLVSLTELFGTEPVFVSAKTYNSYVSDSGDLGKLQNERQLLVKRASELQGKVQSLMSSVAEIARLTQQEFPRDSWRFGAKLHTERSVVYSINTKASLV